MQTYPLALAAGGAATTINVLADLFVYESGSATPSNGDTRIAIKSDNGAEIVLRPGQRVRMPEKAERWTVSAYDKTSAIAGFVIIGSGEFDDANTKNTFTLDASFANQVTVTNTAASRVPVSADITQTIPVSIAGTVNVAGSSVNYTNSFADANIAAVTAQVVFLPVSNPNGAWVELVECAISPSTNTAAWTVVSLIAKATPPANNTDGDVVFIAATPTGLSSSPSPQVNQTQTSRIKIPPGKGLYLNQTTAGVGNPAACVKTVLYTLL